MLAFAEHMRFLYSKYALQLEQLSMWLSRTNEGIMHTEQDVQFCASYLTHYDFVHVQEMCTDSKH